MTQLTHAVATGLRLAIVYIIYASRTGAAALPRTLTQSPSKPRRRSSGGSSRRLVSG
jgi:hypothetical protein